jgi:2-polyprenyl-6-methoxyphenol hydroxylase-like FAD-dependent oxidoreductase
MQSSTLQIPVLIVGGGPVGLALACDLGQRGVRCILVEQGDGVPDHPRATALNSRSMEFMRRWGIADAVHAAGTPDDFPHTALYITSFTGYEIARIERPSHGGRDPIKHSPERPQRCNQLFLDPILAKLANSFDNVQLRHGCRVERVDEASDHVIATVHDRAEDRRFQVVTDYLVDCSGGRSVIRPALGIEMSGSPYVGYFLSIFVRAPELWKHHAMGKAALVTFVDAKGLWRNLVSLDGRELYRLGLTGKPYYDAPNQVDAEAFFRQAVGKHVPHEILSVRRWMARNVVADRYQHGRIFLAGDAAHLNHPAAGLGLNTGLGDAVDLGWKLSAMLAGWGGARLLDSYEVERRPVAIRNIGHAGASHDSERQQPTHPEIAMDTTAGAEARRQMGEDLVRIQTRRVITDGLALGYQYASSPIVCSDGAAALPSSTVEYQPTTLPGSRAPHAWLSDGRSTIDLFGDGFTLLRLGADAPQPSTMERAFVQRGVPLRTIGIADPAVAALCETPLVLVRPDGHVAWRGAQEPADSLVVIDHVRGADAAAFCLNKDDASANGIAS